MATLLSYALCSLADVKENINLASSDTSKDNLIIRKINQATRAIEAYCGRRFQLTSYTDVEYAGTQTDNLILRQRPVTDFTALGIRDSGLNTANWETIDSQLYFVDNAAGVVDLMFNAIGRWNRYRVSYTAGYGTIPEDLAEACASLAAYYVQNADASDIGKMQVKEGQREVRYAKNQQSFKTIMEQLGLDTIIDSYSNNPVMTDR